MCPVLLCVCLSFYVIMYSCCSLYYLTVSVCMFDFSIFDIPLFIFYLCTFVGCLFSIYNVQCGLFEPDWLCSTLLLEFLLLAKRCPFGVLCIRYFLVQLFQGIRCHKVRTIQGKEIYFWNTYYTATNTRLDQQQQLKQQH